MIRINNIKNLDSFIELIQDIAFFKDMDGRYLYFNDRYLEFIQKRREDILNKTVFDFYSPTQATKLSCDDTSILKENRDRNYEEVFTKNDGEIVFFHTTKQIIYDEKQKQLGLFCIVKDITLEKQYETIYKDSKEILEYIAINDDLTKTLDKITSFAEERFSCSKCAILLLAKDKKHLVSGSAKSLPDFYNEAINGIPVGEKIGSCGSAAFKRERVIIESIDKHENWQAYLELTQKANLHACWSEPVFSSKNSLLGTFAVYHDEEKYPSDFQLKLISSYANLAAIAIEKENNKILLLLKEHQILEQSKNANQELSKLFNNASVGLMYVTKDRVIINANQRLADILGYDNPKEMVNMNTIDLHLSRERYIDFGEKNFYSLVDGENNNIEYQLRKKDGLALWCLLSAKALDTNIPADLSRGVLWTISDISKRKVLESEVIKRTHELEEMSIKDELTKLFNRKYYNNKINELFSLYKRYDTIFSVIMYDIDDFKIINDTYGHDIGDKVLVQMSNQVKLLLRETDFLFRIGGEEFIILIPKTTTKEASVIAEKIRKTVSNLHIIKSKKITISLGLTQVELRDTEDSIFQRVDRLLYFSKKNGKNMVSTKILGDVSYAYLFDDETNTLYERIRGNYMNMNAFKNTLMNESYMIKYLECENIITDFTDFEMNFEHFQTEVIEMYKEYAKYYLNNVDLHLKNKKTASYIYKFDNIDSVKPFRELQSSVGVEIANFEKISDIDKFIGFNTKKYFELDDDQLTVCK